ncbi:hypothetical protein [Mycolicibacter minnesotensis]
MTEPAISVTITDSEFTVGELQEFIQTVVGVDAMPSNALIAVTHELGGGPTRYTLTASTAYRGKE